MFLPQLVQIVQAAAIRQIDVKNEEIVFENIFIICIA